MGMERYYPPMSVSQVTWTLSGIDYRKRHETNMSSRSYTQEASKALRELRQKWPTDAERSDRRGYKVELYSQ